MNGQVDYQGVAILLGAIAAFIVTVGGFIMQAATFVRTGQLMRHQGAMAQNVQKIELATNSMKDALVKATREQSLLEGASTERKEEAVRKAMRAQGVAESNKSDSL